MPNYYVDVFRTGYALLTLLVEADSEENAKEKALEEAGNHFYNEHTSEYDVGEAWPEE
jgi:hypothetical protein